MKSYPDPFTSAPSCILDIIPGIETSTFLFAVDHGAIKTDMVWPYVYSDIGVHSVFRTMISQDVLTGRLWPTCEFNANAELMEVFYVNSSHTIHRHE